MSNANAKKKKPIVQKYVSDIIPLVDIAEINGNTVFVDKDGGYMDIIQLNTRDLNAQKDFDIEMDNIAYGTFNHAYDDDYKLICMSYPVDTFTQMDYIERLQSNTQNEEYYQQLDQERELLFQINQDYEQLEFFLMIFGTNKQAFLRNWNLVGKQLVSSKLAQYIFPAKKISIVRKLMNLPSDMAQTNLPYVPAGIPKHMEYNPYLLYTIQPQGGVSWKDEYVIRYGNGYATCVHVYDYKDTVDFGWLRNLLIWPNAVASVDVTSADRAETLRAIDRSIEEQISREAQARYATEQMNAQKIAAQLGSLYDQMTSEGEVLKRIIIRIFFFAKTRKDLEEIASSAITEIEARGYKATIFLEENEWEWRSLLTSYSKQQSFANTRKGRAVSAKTLAAGHPYHFSCLLDPYGFPFGYTPTDGVVLFDPYQKDNKRLSYCGVIFGRMGAGKSTLLKKLIRGDAIKGNYIRGFATNKEYNQLIRHFNGSIINLDGTDGILNVLQVYKTDEQEHNSFSKHIAKVQTFFKFLCPEADSLVLDELGILLQVLYRKHMKYDYQNNSQAQITGLSPKSYPIFSDFLKVILDDIYYPGTTKQRADISQNHFDRVEQIALVIRNLIDNFGKMFNGHSTLRNFETEQIVFFNVENVKSFGDRIFDAQLYNAYTLLWDNMIYIGAPQWKQYNSGQLDIRDVKHYTIYMDEAHMFVNANKLIAVDTLSQFTRESRKYFGGIILASQSISDFLPESASTVGMAAIRQLFNLSQYKWIFQQGSETYQALQMAFRNELTEGDLESISQLPQGDCILWTGAESIRLHISLNEDEKRLFAGGA